MNERKHTKLIHEGAYVAEVEVSLTDANQPWGPYLSLDDARRLDAVRDALRRGDLPTATKLSRVYRLTPVSAA